MNAYTTTASDLATALLGNKRVEVRVCTKSYFRGTVTYVVSVGGEMYEVSERMKTALENGHTPEELELEPYVEEDDEQEDGGESPASLLRWYHSRVL